MSRHHWFGYPWEARCHAGGTHRVLLNHLVDNGGPVVADANLVTQSKDAQRRPCHLRVERLAEAARWFEHTQQAWQARFDRLERFLASVESSQPNETKGDTNGTP